MNHRDLKTINLTAKLYRFVKSNGAYPYFKDALKTTNNGRMFLDTLYALRFDSKGKKEDCANDPIKWIFLHNPNDGKIFLSDFFNDHIYWSDSKPNSHFWENLHYNWRKHFYTQLFPIIYGHTTVQDYINEENKDIQDKSDFFSAVSIATSIGSLVSSILLLNLY